MSRRFASGLLALALAGCTSLEPKYVRPEPPVPLSWPVGDSYLRQSEAGLPIVGYRDIFRDPRLQALVEQALANNRDLRIAAANIASARAQYSVQRAERLPQVAAGAGAGVSGGGGGRGTDTNFSIDVGVSRFELDLFGRVRSLSRSALDQYFSTEAAARATRLSLVGEIASAYFTLAADRSLLAVARATEANAARSVELTGARLRGGIASRIDLRQAQTVLEQARSDAAAQVTRVAQDRNALQLLVGAPLDEANLPPSIEAVDGLVAELPAGLSSTVLLRRPDVVEAEFQLRAANARIGAARAAFFPTISLTGLLGLASGGLTSLFSGGAFNFNAGVNASVPIFDAGANRGNLQYARAQRELFLARYEQTIQTAFREVSDALARRGTIGEQFGAESRLVADAQDNYRLTDARYREGIENFLATLDAQRTLYSAQQRLVRTRLERATNLADLYRTLGGDALIDTGSFAKP
ncbi:MAG: efflux transporter outer membrane subunit [Alphaproteobacteria bacterium]|nr:efflux transporter outer membrane subunit [Alphaproteobacteria bacterium]MBV9372094.1 efflux transporter outer membrane subunit [Alphaproteobacteria bacterium]MBV9901737.1 efflux transporter outer membrane subunit [Alphaproteobacteria bacterium]